LKRERQKLVKGLLLEEVMKDEEVRVRESKNVLVARKIITNKEPTFLFHAQWKKTCTL
jgi:hypothetical protein